MIALFTFSSLNSRTLGLALRRRPVSKDVVAISIAPAILRTHEAQMVYERRLTVGRTKKRRANECDAAVA